MKPIFFSLFKGVIVVIFVSFGKMQCNTFFDKINFENFLLIKVYIQTLKNWERGSKIQNLLKPLVDTLLKISKTFRNCHIEIWKKRNNSVDTNALYILNF